jgi:hypothetical protein
MSVFPGKDWQTADPAELGFDPACFEVKLELYERLTDRIAWTVDPLPERRADW